jgi:hypothetical protein
MTEATFKKVQTVSTTSPTVEVLTHQKTERVKIQIQAPPNKKRIRKKCLGCCDTFACLQSKNYDYCSSCEINGGRYANKDSPCSECDGSGLVKFKGQPPRNCKLCYLARQETELSLNQKGRENIFAK